MASPYMPMVIWGHGSTELNPGVGSILAKVFLIRPCHMKQGAPRLYKFCFLD
jgi:hypothetical protein